MKVQDLHPNNGSTVNLQTETPQTKDLRVQIPGELPILWALEFHPLRIQNLLESNPLKSRLLVGGLTAGGRKMALKIRLPVIAHR